MSIDMSQFLQTFYEESFEGLDVMESELLNLDAGAADTEVVNTIFRAAHSIKGGSATFGLDNVATFTHVLETLLDEMRDGKRQVTPEAVNLLLQSVDCLRGMLSSNRDDEAFDQQNADHLRQQLEALLGTSDATPTPAAEPAAEAGASASCGWHIIFRPHEHLFLTGNDPVRILRELESLGELVTHVDCSKLPDFSGMDPEKSYLGWEMDLKSDVDRLVVEEVFAWTDGDCDLEITPIVDRRQGDRRAGEDRRQGDRRASGTSGADTASIRVGIDKVDSVINLVGELVITQSMLSTLGEGFDMSKIHQLAEGLSQLERNTRELQEQVMRMRMLPISFTFSRIPRMVHDLSQKLGKKVELKLSGEQTELDKTVIEKIGDPLVHLVRNSLDHGLETPQERIAAGKPEVGTLWLSAYHKGGNIIIEVKDDGHGLNADRILAKAIERELVAPDAQLTPEQINELILLPGFSTAQEVSDVSGRGVGMDVVRRNIQSLGGSIEISSQPGAGSTFTVRLPLTLAILDGQSVAVGEEVYIVPLVSIIESIQIKPEMINRVAGKGETFKLRDEYVPIIRLYEVFGTNARATELVDGLLVVVEGDGHKIGLFVDDLLGQQQVVIKSLETNYQRVDGISGATILGDGAVALILDVPSLIRLANHGTTVQQLKLSA